MLLVFGFHFVDIIRSAKIWLKMNSLLPASFASCFVIVAPLYARAAQTNAAPARLDRNHLLVYRDHHGVPEPAKSVRDWEKRRAEIVRGMESVMGPLPGREKRCALDLKVEEEVDCGAFVRRSITCASEPGSRVPEDHTTGMVTRGAAATASFG